MLGFGASGVVLALWTRLRERAPLDFTLAKAPSLVPWAWGVNGFFTVIGSVMAMTLGMIFGFTTVLIVAGTCYVACFLAVWMGRWHRPPAALADANTRHAPPLEPALYSPSGESQARTLVGALNVGLMLRQGYASPASPPPLSLCKLL